MCWQQGTPVVDVCIYYGTGIEKRIQYKQDSALMDLGYQYDYVNSDVILNQMSVQDGKICLQMEFHMNYWFYRKKVEFL